jgi:predicted flap endonuclease-1-like 5' DNA nuclease
MEGNYTSDLLFIIIVLIGSALLGFLIGYFVNARYKKVQEALEELKKELGSVKTQVKDLAGYKDKHTSETENMESDLSKHEDNIKELQKMGSDIENLKKNVSDHSHEAMGKELAALKSKLSEIDKRTAPIAFEAERAEKVIGRKVAENDLTTIEGIGPKISEMLTKHGITSWQDLSKSTPEALKAMLLKEGGDSFAVHDPTTWPAQAGMALEGKWELLKEFQDYLKGGKTPEK